MKAVLIFIIVGIGGYAALPYVMMYSGATFNWAGKGFVRDGEIQIATRSECSYAYSDDYSNITESCIGEERNRHWTNWEIDKL